MRHIDSALSVLAIIALAGSVTAQTTVPADKPRTSAEIRIGLPKGADPVVAITPGQNRIELDLPEGSSFPSDFESASGGLLRQGEVIPLGDTRIRLRLDLAQGLLHRIVYDPQGIVLRLESRFAADRAGEEGADQYLLGPDDRINLIVHNHPELASKLTLTRDGTITAPMVGEITAAGLTPRQLAAKIAELLGRNYLVDPQVDVDVDVYRSQWVMVTGDVKIPGKISLRGGTRLKEVLSEAGGFDEKSGEEITVSRRIPGSDDYEVLHVDRMEFENGEANPLLRNGDIIDVPRTKYCYVSGEVRVPSRLRIERDLTLLKALTLVEGLTEWADRKAIKVLRAGPDAKVEFYNLVKIEKGKAQDPPLTGGEIIVVQRRLF